MTFDGWTDVTLPNGRPYGPVAGPVAGPVRLTVAAGATRQFTLRQTVPARAPAGSYTYTARTGLAYPTTEQSDSFAFTKLPPTASLQAAKPGLAAETARPAEIARAKQSSGEVGAAPVRPAPVRPALHASAPPEETEFAFDPAVWPVVDVTTGLPFGAEQAHAAASDASLDAETAETDTAPASLALPMEPALHPAYPNPFTATTTVRYDLAHAGTVRLAVYDALGRRVALLVDEAKEPGRHRARFDASRLASGVYVVRMTTSNYVQTHRLTLVR